MSAQTWREQSHSTPQEHDAIREAWRAFIAARWAKRGWQWGGVA